MDIIFRYGDSGTDIGVSVPLYDNRVAMVETPSDLMAHFSPKPIPNVLKALAGSASG